MDLEIFGIQRNTCWKEAVFTAFDIETSGAYPLGSSVIEFGGFRSTGEFYETLIHPPKSLSPEVIRIHGITNEMVVDAPPMTEVVGKIYEFLNPPPSSLEPGRPHILMAHHAPFDIGFLAIEWERAGLPFPKLPVLCTSLLSQKVITDSANHRLQTLIGHLHLKPGQAHRALYDAEACLQIGIQCMERVGPEAQLEEIFSLMKGPIRWESFGVFSQPELGPPLRKDLYRILIEAIQNEKLIDLVYSKGLKKGFIQRLKPLGLVRNPFEGDYLQAICLSDARSRRFYLGKIEDVGLV